MPKISRFVALALPLAIPLSFACPAGAEPQPGSIVPVEAKYAFVPVGFDDNDTVELVVDGYLPSGCFKLAEPVTRISEATKHVYITPQARYFAAPCVEAMVPFSQTIKLGTLVKGSYQVTVGANLQQLSLEVKHANTPYQDDVFYAPVDRVTAREDPHTGILTATLEGRFTDSCMNWQEVRAIDNGATINLLPMITVSGVDCKAVEIPYTKTVRLPDSISIGRHLLHVRSLSGQAVNDLFYRTDVGS